MFDAACFHHCDPLFVRIVLVLLRGGDIRSVARLEMSDGNYFAPCLYRLLQCFPILVSSEGVVLQDVCCSVFSLGS